METNDQNQPDSMTDNLSPAQEQSIIALLSQPTVKLAAEAAGVGERTLYRWMKDREFLAAYRQARRDAFSHAVSLTQRYAPMAVQTLVKLFNDPSGACRRVVRDAQVRTRRDGVG